MGTSQQDNNPRGNSQSERVLWYGEAYPDPSTTHSYIQPHQYQQSKQPVASSVPRGGQKQPRVSQESPRPPARMPKA